MCTNPRAWVSALLLLTACPAPKGPPPDGGEADAGVDGGASPFAYYTLDTTSPELRGLSLAVGAGDRVGVAYFVTAPGSTQAGTFDGGSEAVPNYDIRYVEWSAGAASAPARVQTVQRPYGVSLAFQPSGEPAVAYLGGGSDQSVYWLQSDTAVAYRSGATWTEQVAVHKSNEAPCADPVSNVGFLVGLNPGLAFDGSQAYVAYRDAHGGQFPQGDWDASDVEVAIGGPTSWTKQCAVSGGASKLGAGGHIQLVVAGGQPAVVYDHVLSSGDGPGANVNFLHRTVAGKWLDVPLLSSPNTHSGPTLAYDSQEGYGVAAVDLSSGLLAYTSSVDGATWSASDPVFQTGTGGLYPSLAFDPVHHEPAIAFYVCSARTGVAESDCPAADNDLRVSQRISNRWQETVVDPQGGLSGRLGFLSNGKRVVAYRRVGSGQLILAVEQ